ncbi:MAG TPA: glycosyltransferase family 2 protein [Acidimicrobiales bacterium]|nr:glycosyltransferase family 2 protein [Acidimicrobiales bacterium]
MSGRVGVVVVNYNAGDHLVECVRSVRRAGVEQVVVVDNASSDGSVQKLVTDDPKVTVVDAGTNLGYGGGVNRGLAHMTDDYVLVTNPDVVVDAGAVTALAEVLDADGDVGIVGPRIDEVDGARYPSARRFPRLGDAVGHAFLGLINTNNRFSRRYLMTDTTEVAGRDVDWVSGACFLARRSALAAIGGFDEAYFMYLEDVDLCWRASRAGWRVRYEPGAQVVHVQGLSTSATPYRMLAAHHASLLRFWWRTTGWPGRLLAPAVVAGLALRLVVMTVRRAIVGRGGN